MERNKKLTVLSQNLRKNQTAQERKLWYQVLRNYAYPFRRQYVIGNYIVDFYCHQARLVIELDGSQHYEPEKMADDQRRSEYLQSLGLMVLRFTNTDIRKNLSGVCEVIDQAVKSRVPE